MPNELKKKIIEDLDKTGFPLEVSVLSQLDRRNWMVYPSSLYKDPETSTSREIDIHAVKVDYTYSYKIPEATDAKDTNKFISHLVIQCRKTTKPWVFFDNAQPNWPQIPPQNFKSEKADFHDMLLLDIDKSKVRKGAAAKSQADNMESLGLRKHRYIRAPFHKSYHEVFSTPSTESKIYESLITVTKALDYFKNHYGTGRYILHLFIPIIVLDGTLWSASIKNKKDDTIHKDRVLLKSVDGLFVIFGRLIFLDKRKIYLEEEQIIEIITYKAFRKKMAVIERDNKELYKCWTRFINLK